MTCLMSLIKGPLALWALETWGENVCERKGCPSKHRFNGMAVDGEEYEMMRGAVVGIFNVAMRVVQWQAKNHVIHWVPPMVKYNVAELMWGREWDHDEKRSAIGVARENAGNLDSWNRALIWPPGALHLSPSWYPEQGFQEMETQFWILKQCLVHQGWAGSTWSPV